MNRKLNVFLVFTVLLSVTVFYFVAPRSLSRDLWKKYKDVAMQPVKHGCYDIGLMFTSFEDSASRLCVDNFENIRKEQRNINHGKMEHDRWTMHKYLHPDSQIVEVGGFKGVDAEKFIKMADPYYIVLEPVSEYNKILEEKFGNNSKFTLHKFGLGKKNKKIRISFTPGDATSVFRIKTNEESANHSQTLHIRDAKVFFTSMGVQRKSVDLLHINCEGCEFELLELIIAESLAKYFNHIQFQFHVDLPGIPQFQCRYCQIMQVLSRTHEPMFQYSYTWQSWKLKS